MADKAVNPFTNIYNVGVKTLFTAIGIFLLATVLKMSVDPFVVKSKYVFSNEKTFIVAYKTY